MEEDPLMKFFYRLRSKILKEGALDVLQVTDLRQVQMPDDLTQFGPSPPNAKRWFVGGNGVGWVVELPDGAEEHFYITLPTHMVSIERYFNDAPSCHLGQVIEDKSIERLSAMYLDYLRKIIESAKGEFM